MPFSAAQAAFGVSALVTRPAPDHAPITTIAVWDARPLEDQRAPGQEYSRLDPRRRLALSRSEVPTTPIGTVIECPLEAGGESKTWRCEGRETSESDCWRIVVTEALR